MRIQFYGYFVFIGYPRRRCSRTPSTACSSFPASLRLNRSRNRAVGRIVRLICPPKEGSFKPRSWGRFVLPLLSIVRGRVGGCSRQLGCSSRCDGLAEMTSEKLPAKNTWSCGSSRFWYSSRIGVASNRDSGDSRGTVFSHSLVTKHPFSDI